MQSSIFIIVINKFFDDKRWSLPHCWESNEYILEPVQFISPQVRDKPNPISNTSRTSTIYQSSSSFPFWNIESMHAVSKFYGQVIPKNKQFSNFSMFEEILRRSKSFAFHVSVRKKKHSVNNS